MIINDLCKKHVIILHAKEDMPTFGIVWDGPMPARLHNDTSESAVVDLETI